MATATAGSAACSGGSSPRVLATTSAPSVGVSSPPAAGLINDVKQATVVAVCANLKQAQDLVGTGIATDQLRAAVLAALGQLSKPPHPNGSLILARAMRQEVRRHKLAAAVNAGLKWCSPQ